MFSSRNVKQIPSIDKKSPFKVTNAFVSLITSFKWLYNLIIDFKFNFFEFFVQIDYNWMFPSRNVKRKPSIDKKSSLLSLMPSKALLFTLNDFIISLLILC